MGDKELVELITNKVIDSLAGRLDEIIDKKLEQRNNHYVNEVDTEDEHTVTKSKNDNIDLFSSVIFNYPEDTKYPTQMTLFNKNAKIKKKDEEKEEIHPDILKLLKQSSETGMKMDYTKLGNVYNVKIINQAGTPFVYNFYDNGKDKPLFDMSHTAFGSAVSGSGAVATGTTLASAIGTVGSSIGSVIGSTSIVNNPLKLKIEQKLFPNLYWAEAEDKEYDFTGWVLLSNVKQILDDRGLKTSWLQQKTQIPQSTLWSIINNEKAISLENAMKISIVMDMPITKLFSYINVDDIIFEEKNKDNK